MRPLDKNYLLLQFRDKIYSKNGTEFQSFFENIMEKAFLDFKKVPAGGGDAGNDGWIKKAGKYYQVYAPNTPAIKDTEAARKLKKDFNKLKANWNKISDIKEYYFVFNDKYFGSKKPEEAIVDLEKENPNIIFDVFLAQDLENLFFSLDETDILSLGFNVDLREAISNAYEYLQKAEIELDRENTKFAQKILENSKDIISNLNDEKLSLYFEFLECRYLKNSENIDEAKERYTNISKRFPSDPRALLYLAEIYLNENDFNNNELFLEKAKAIDDKHWQLKLGELARKLKLGEKIDLTGVEEKRFQDKPRIKADLYRFYAQIYASLEDYTNADSFIEKAIHFNSNSFSNYIVKLSLVESKLFSSQGTSQGILQSDELLVEINEVERKFTEYGDIGARNTAILNIKKLNALRVQENYPEFENKSQETFKLILTCYFDSQIDHILSVLMAFASAPINDFNQLLKYLKNSKKEISEDLLKVLIFQFIIRDDLYRQGKEFFKEINNQRFINFINDIESERHEDVLKFIENDTQFAVVIASTLKSSPKLRKKIIEKLPDDKNIQKKKLKLLLNFDEKDIDEAYDILKQLDLTALSYYECKPILEIIQEKKAWDFEIIILKKLIEKERNEKDKYNLNLQLFNAYFNLEIYPEVINLGEKLLQQDKIENKLNTINKEALLANTIIACFQRGKVEEKAFARSKKILEKYQLTQPSFEFKAGVEAEVLLKNNAPEEALKSIVEGVKIKKNLSSEEYAKLNFTLAIKIVNQFNLNLDSLTKCEENTFVKLNNINQWYFIGDDNELDAIKITKSNDKYTLFIDKKIGDKILFDSRYSSEVREEIIEKIFSIEKYVLWQSVRNFENLSKDGVLNGVQMIEVPHKDETIDPQNLLKFLEDLHKGKEPLFEMYCKDPVPLAMLAVNEGGLTKAIARIQQENKGFINFSTGAIEELEKQKEVAKRVINKKTPFYIDGTSALVLSEIGLLKKIHPHLPNIKVSQSVINLMAETADKFRYTAGQEGYLGYSQGKITISSVEKDKREVLQSNFIESIGLLESTPENISVISSANKADCFSEQNIPAELIDACILAQQEKLPVLTDDYLYLKMNELQTQKGSPEYFSSFGLLRVLYEEGKISFDEFLNFFGYLSSYRFRFLSFNSDDIVKAVFGDGKIITVSPENIRKLNFPLTLSEEYGVPFHTSFKVVGEFLLKVLMDNSITSDVVEKIYIEIIESFPTDKSKKDFGQMLLRSCLRSIENIESEFVLYQKNQILYEKMDKLLQTTENINSIIQL